MQICCNHLLVCDKADRQISGKDIRNEMKVRPNTIQKLSMQVLKKFADDNCIHVLSRKGKRVLKDDYIKCIQRFLKESANDPEILNVTNMKIGTPTAITTFGNDLIYVIDHDDKFVIEVRLFAW